MSIWVASTSLDAVAFVKTQVFQLHGQFERTFTVLALDLAKKAARGTWREDVTLRDDTGNTLAVGANFSALRKYGPDWTANPAAPRITSVRLTHPMVIAVASLACFLGASSKVASVVWSAAGFFISMTLSQCCVSDIC